MLTLTVIRRDGRSRESRSFDRPSITLGRAATNDWVLADTERVISKRHLEITRTGGRLQVIDHSTNGVFVNGEAAPLGRGNSREVTKADYLIVGEYRIELEVDDPLPQATLVTGADDDPFGFGLQSTGPASERNPLGDEEFPGNDDPFAQHFEPPDRPAAAPLGLPEGNEGQAGSFEPEGGDALLDELDELLADLPKELSSLESSLGEDDLSGREAERDPLDDLDAAAEEDFDLATPHVRGAATPSDHGAVTNDYFRPARAAPPPAPEPTLAPPPAAAPSPEPRAETPPAAAAGETLHRTLVKELGLSEEQARALLTPEGLARFAATYRGLVAGVCEILAARAEIKNEMRANRTIIAARDNNPLKFAPTPEAAIAHLLGPAQPGYLDGTTAIEEAVRDLKAHQLGMLAGMQQALRTIMRRFDPQVLKQRIERRSPLDKLVPMSRNAAYWALYERFYGELAEEAERHFLSFFGTDIASGYERQVERVRRGGEWPDD